MRIILLKMIFTVLTLFTMQAQAASGSKDYTFPESGIVMSVPEDFAVMDETMKNFKYPSARRPEAVLTDESTQVNIALTAGKTALPASELDKYKDILVKFMPNYHPTAQPITLAGGHKAWLIAFVSQAADGPIHNLLMVTSWQDKAVIAAFNATEESWPAWQTRGEATLRSLRFP